MRGVSLKGSADSLEMRRVPGRGWCTGSLDDCGLRSAFCDDLAALTPQILPELDETVGAIGITEPFLPDALALDPGLLRLYFVTVAAFGRNHRDLLVRFNIVPLMFFGMGEKTFRRE